MKKVQLYFATNRKHKGKDRWNPKGYRKIFSSDGHENLRFGGLSFDVDPAECEKYLKFKFNDDTVGDGENLSTYLSKQSKTAKITAYEDLTNVAEAPIEFENNSSTHFFRDLKEHMTNGFDVVVFIHGYAVNWNDAVGSALSLEFMLNSKRANNEKSVKVVLFSWPSNGSNIPYAAYISDYAAARDSGKAVGRAILILRNFLLVLQQGAKRNEEELCGSKIHLLCHSMGNYVLQSAIKTKIDGYVEARSLGGIFDQIFLCAPDVSDDAFENDGFSRLHELGKNVTIYYNNEDLAMRFSKYTKHFDDRLGHTGNAYPNRIHNKVHQVDCSFIIKGFVEHSYYLWANVNHDIQKTIAGLPFDDPSRKRKREAQSREWTMV